MKKILPFLALVLVIALGFFAWRLTHPALTDEQQIAANLAGIESAASNKSASGVASYLSKNFKFNGIKKSEFQNQLVGAFLQYRVVKLQTDGVKTQVKGDAATSVGGWNLGIKSEFTSPEQTTSGQFELKWRKEDGEWKIVEANGQGELPS